MRISLLTTTVLCTMSCAAFAQTAPVALAADSSAVSADKAANSGAPGDQSGPSEQAAAGQTAPTEGLTEVVVTAQRRQESLQRAAVAVDVVQGSDLIAAGVTEPGRLGELAPSISIQQTSTGNLVFLRGVGNFTVVPGSDPAVAFNYDGVYIGRPTSTNGLFFDLDRVEVLKGPQGTLYGRNATGGAVNVLPTQPKVGEFSGYATGSYGNHDALNIEGAINVPLGNDGALRVSGSIADRDGYNADGTDDQRARSLRVQMKAKLTPDLTVRVSGDYSSGGGAGASVSYVGRYQYNPVAAKYAFIPSNVPLGQGLYTPASQAFRTTATAGAAGRRIDAIAPYPFQNNDFYGANAQIDYATGFGTFTLVPAWRYASLDYLSSAVSFPYRQREKDEQFSLEARFAGERVGIFDYTLGALFYDERINARTSLTNASVVVFTQPNYRTKSVAPFARLTAHVTDQLRVVGGIRWTQDKKQFRSTVLNAAISCVVRVANVPTCPNVPLFPLVDSPTQLPFALPAAGSPPTPIIIGGIPTGAVVIRGDRVDNNRLKDSKFTYRAAVEFDVAAQSLLYASVETGFRSGGFSSATGFETYKPELITAYTVGLKNRFFDNKLQLNLEGFYWKYTDQQVNFVGLDLTGRSTNLTQNIGQSTIKGVEAEARFLATRTTLLSANVQYLDAVNNRFAFPAGVAAAGAPPAPSGCQVTPTANPVQFNVDCAGFRSYNSPRWTLNLAAQQTFELGDYKLIFGADTQYKSSRNIGFAYLPEQVIGSTWLSNAQISIGPSSDKWSIAAFVRNIENNRTPVFSALHPTANLLSAYLSAPRTALSDQQGRW